MSRPRSSGRRGSGWRVRLSPLAIWAASGAAVQAQTLGGGAGVDVPVWRFAGALALCLALAVGGAFALRARMNAGGSAGKMPLAQISAAWLGRPGRSASHRRLDLIEVKRLNHQVDICLMTCDGADFLIATSPSGAFLIPRGQDAADPRRAPP